MKRLAAIFIVTAAITGAAPMAADARVPGGAGDRVCTSITWPLTLHMIPYCAE